MAGELCTARERTVTNDKMKHNLKLLVLYYSKREIKLLVHGQACIDLIMNIFGVGTSNYSGTPL